MKPLDEALAAFCWRGRPLCAVPYGHGHINETYAVACSSGHMYILQKINRAVFQKPEELMENVAAVTEFLARQTSDPRRCLRLVPVRDGRRSFVDSREDHWRAFPFLTDGLCLQAAETGEDLRQSGLAFGRFQRQLADFPAQTLHEAIPNFHNTVDRYAKFHAALEADVLGRAKDCRPEIRFCLDREPEAGCIVDKLASGLLPLRVTHNDTKLNNVMLDRETREALCVLDLDTVMPGSALYDYGDAIRFGASTAAEDERDLSKVSMSLSLFRAYTEGFLSACRDSLTPLEIELLPTGAKLMTLECGLRFLTDHLCGDTYFRISREGHNLDRARTQFKLAADMEEKMPQMRQIIQEAILCKF